MNARSDAPAAVATRQAAALGVRFRLLRSDPPGRAGRRTPPVLLLHGVPQTSDMWRPLMARLGTDRVAVAPDLKGLGGSEDSGGYGMGDLTDELVALLLHEVGDSDRPVDLVGHDWGGILALSIAGTRPDLVRRLVVVNAPYRSIDPLRAWHLPLFQLPLLPELLLRPATIRRMIRYGWRAPQPPSPELLDGSAGAYEPPARVRAMLSYYRRAGRGLRALPQAAPEQALVLWGAEDPVLPLPVGEAVVRQLQRGRTDPAAVRMVTVPGAGHFVIDEAPDVALPAIVDFLRAP